MSKRASKSAGLAVLACPLCRQPVLAAHRGEVTAVGKAEILSVTRDGYVVGKCECGKRVIWEVGTRRQPT